MTSTAEKLTQGLSALLIGLARPGVTAARLADGCFTAPSVAVLGAALAWSALSLALGLAGHAPSAPVLLGEARSYYLVQAAFLPAALILGWLLLARVAHLGLAGDWRRTARALSAPYASAILWLLLVPDAVVFAVAGFDGLGPLMRFTGPLLLVGAWLVGARALVAAQGLRIGPAAARALSGLLAQALLLAPLVR